jgi:hypothetical protein
VSAVTANSFTLRGKNIKMVPYNCKNQLQSDAAGEAKIINACKYNRIETPVTITVQNVPVEKLGIRVGDFVGLVGNRSKYVDNKAITAEFEQPSSDQYSRPQREKSLQLVWELVGRQARLPSNSCCWNSTVSTLLPLINRSTF